MKTTATASAQTSAHAMADRSFHVEQHPLEQVPSCPRCGAGSLETYLEVTDHSVSKKRFQLCRCRDCGFLLTAPRPDQAHIGQYYESDNYISHSNSRGSLQDKLYQLARRWAIRRKFAIVKHHQPQGRALDIGCGTGEFLAYLQSRGYQVAGVEPAIRAREQAIAQHSISVLPDLASVQAKEDFQVVTLWHVLEHLPDPRGTFKKLFALMADRGLLLIAVPDRGSWDRAHYGANWAAWDVPRHLSHFRRSDIAAFLHEHGFELLEMRRMWLDAPYVALLSERYRGASLPVAMIKGMAIGLWSNLMSLLQNRPSSSTLFIARKSEP